MRVLPQARVRHIEGGTPLRNGKSGSIAPEEALVSSKIVAFFSHSVIHFKNKKVRGVRK